MHDFAAGGIEAAEVGGIESLFQEVDYPLCVVRDDVDGNGIVVLGFPACGH
jgi:hypothetical protein